MSDRAGLPGYDEWLSREPDWDDYETPEERAAAERRAEDPPDWYLEEEAERHARIHRDQDHGGAECDCPVAEPSWCPPRVLLNGQVPHETGMCAVLAQPGPLRRRGSEPVAIHKSNLLATDTHYQETRR